MLPDATQDVNRKPPLDAQARNPFLHDGYWDRKPEKPWPANCRPRPLISHYISCPAYDKISVWLSKQKKLIKARERGRMLRQQGGRVALMKRLKAVFGLRCQYCRATGTDKRPDTRFRVSESHWTIDRIDPNGDYSPSNITLACSACNSSKQKKPLKASVRSLANAEAAPWKA